MKTFFRAWWATSLKNKINTNLVWFFFGLYGFEIVFTIKKLGLKKLPIFTVLLFLLVILILVNDFKKNINNYKQRSKTIWNNQPPALTLVVF